jgi:hypothetical protein
MLRPSPPTLRDARNGKQALDLFSISSVNSKYIPNREIVICSFDYPDLISSADFALNYDAQVGPGPQRFGKSFGKHLIVHPNPEPPARNPRFGYFKYGGSDRPALADGCVVHCDSLGREIFPKLAVLERAAEFIIPPPRVFHCVRVYSFIGTPVRFAIRLIVSFQIHSTSSDPTVHWRFPNSACGRPTVKFKLAHASNIYR